MNMQRISVADVVNAYQATGIAPISHCFGIMGSPDRGCALTALAIQKLPSLRAGQSSWDSIQFALGITQPDWHYFHGFIAGYDDDFPDLAGNSEFDDGYADGAAARAAMQPIRDIG